jgi:hypothetical protein
MNQHIEENKVISLLTKYEFLKFDWCKKQFSCLKIMYFLPLSSCNWLQYCFLSLLNPLSFGKRFWYVGEKVKESCSKFENQIDNSDS